MNNKLKLNIAIIGGTGYTGKELLKLLTQHPFVEKIDIYAQTSAGSLITDVFPELTGLIEDTNVKSIESLNYNADLYFTSLPHGEAMNHIPDLIAERKKVIDIGSDYRLYSPVLFKQWYGLEHTSYELLKTRIYGLADVLSDSDYKFDLIANPGCYPTAVLLPLLPIVEHFADKIISINTVAYSGVSGAGKSAKAELMMAEMFGNAKAYNLNKHRHEPEIVQALMNAGLVNKPYSFSTHLLPISTGIYSTTTVNLCTTVLQNEVDEILNQKYLSAPFVRIRKVPPEIKWVLGTNFCDIHASVGPNRIILASAIDNLIKGASGQAVQNMNRLYGFDQTTGLLVSRNYISQFFEENLKTEL